MEKEEAIRMIDEHKNKLVHPVDLLHWTWLRVIVNAATDDEWAELNLRAAEIMSK